MNKEEIIEEMKKTTNEMYGMIAEVLTEEELKKELIKLKTSLEIVKVTRKVMNEIKNER